MTMDQYKKRLKRRMVLLSALALLCAGLLVYNQFWASETLKNNIAFSFQCGLAASGALMLAFVLFQYRRVIVSDEKLRLHYNQENDERKKAIRSKAGFPMVVVLSIVLILAGMVAGYFNTTVFAVLISVALFQLVVSSVAKLIYLKKM